MTAKTINAKCPACREPVQFTLEMVNQGLTCENCGAKFRPKPKDKPSTELSSQDPTDFEVPAPPITVPVRRSRTKWIAAVIIGLILTAIGADGPGTEEKGNAKDGAQD
jgi:DNA-directed RNA polymerase subunit RPC12/RpoP